MKILSGEGLTYDDVLLAPGYSEVLPSQVETGTYFSKRIKMNIPLCSSAMDTVTEARTAIVMAQLGGIGVIHKNLDPEQQASEVRRVKKYEAGMIQDPVTLSAERDLFYANELMAKYKISGLPVVDESNKLIGIITNRDIRFQKMFKVKVKEVMTSENLVTAPEGTSLEEAKKILQEHRIEKLPVISEEGFLKGLITIKDIEKSIEYPQSNKDSLGRLRVAAAVGVGVQDEERIRLLVEAQVDALVVDSAHGHSKGVIDKLKELKKKYPEIDIIAGNVATEAACEALIEAGADGIKVGVGPGSICTTRVIAGIGVPQLQAVMDCASKCREYGVPLIADGGIKYSGDIVKALGAGASSVMVGSLFAGTDEAPGERILYQGRVYKVYRGMGSMGAMDLGSKDRYGQAEVKDAKKLVAEGIEGQVPYRGSLSENVYQLVGGLRSGMGYVGAKNLEQLHEKAVFRKISSSSLKESHPHDVKMTKEAPNYRG